MGSGLPRSRNSWATRVRTWLPPCIRSSRNGSATCERQPRRLSGLDMNERGGFRDRAALLHATALILFQGLLGDADAAAAEAEPRVPDLARPAERVDEARADPEPSGGFAYVHDRDT